MPFLLKVTQTWTLRSKGGKGETGHSFFPSSAGISTPSGKQGHSRTLVDGGESLSLHPHTSLFHLPHNQWWVNSDRRE